MNLVEFNSIMDKINEELQVENVPIFIRPFKACGKFSELTKTKFSLDSTISKKISIWFENKYEERLFLRSGYNILIEINGDLYTWEAPIVYGEVIFTKKDILARINNISKNTTEYLMKSNKCGLIFAELLYTLDAYYFISGQSHPILKNINNDLENAINICVNYNKENGGAAYWNLAIVIEKILKFFIEAKGEKYKYIHKIKYLAEEAYKYGLPNIDKYINHINAKAEHRYTEEVTDIRYLYKTYKDVITVIHYVKKALDKIKQ